MRTTSKMVLVLLIVALALSAASCQAKRAPTAAAQPAKPVTIRVITMDQAAMTTGEMDSVAKDFMAANPNIKVEMEYVAYEALRDKIVTAMATTPPPYDVIMVDVVWYAEFAKAGYLADVTDKITPEMRNNTFKTGWNVVTVGGKVYGMPWLLDCKYFFYNAKLLKDAGFDNPPKTWEEMLEQAKVIKSKGICEYPIAWSWAQHEAAICDFTTLLCGNGGRFLDDAGKPTFNDAKGVATLEWMVKSLDDGLSNPASPTELEGDVQNLLAGGKAVFCTNWLSTYDFANNNKEESQVTGQVKMALMPVFDATAKEGVKSATVDGSSGFSVVATSPNKDAAWEYAKFLCSQPTQMKYSLHMLPIWTTSYEGDNLQKLLNVSPVTPVTVPMFKEQFPYANLRPVIPYYAEGSKALQLALQEALTKQKTPQQALDAAAAKWADLGSK